MKVSKKDIDKLNSVLSVSIEKTDYESKGRRSSQGL